MANLESWRQRRAGATIHKEVKAFSKETYFNGFRELFDQDSYLQIRIAWLVLFLICVALMIYQLVVRTSGYLTQEPVSQVTVKPLNWSAFDRITICFSFSTIIQNLQMNASTVSLDEEIWQENWHQFGYLESSIDTIGEMSRISAPFLNTAEMVDFSTFKSIPLNLDAEFNETNMFDILTSIMFRKLTSFGDSNSTDKRLKINPFSRPTSMHFLHSSSPSSFAHTSDHSQIGCQRFSVNISSGKFFYMFHIPLQVDNLSYDDQHYLFTNNYLRLTHFSPMAVFEDAAYKTVIPEIVDQSDYLLYIVSLAYQIMPIKYEYLNLTNRPCVDAKGLLIPKGQSHLVCEDECVQQKHLDRFKCQFVKHYHNFSSGQSNTSACNYFNIFDALRSDMHDSSGKMTIADWTLKVITSYQSWLKHGSAECKGKCKSFRLCEEWDLDFRISSETFNPKTAASEQMRSNFSGSSYIFWLSARCSLPANMILYQEIFPQNLEDFLGDFGGILSLFTGASILCLFHVGFYIVYRIHNKRSQRAVPD